MMDFLFASQDASTASLTWTLTLLADHPEVLQKVLFLFPKGSLLFNSLIECIIERTSRLPFMLAFRCLVRFASQKIGKWQVWLECSGDNASGIRNSGRVSCSADSKASQMHSTISTPVCGPSIGSSPIMCSHMRLSAI